MTEQITRAFAGDLSIRADTEGRTVAGIVVPFDRVARVSDGGKPYEERFQRGAFKRTIDRGATDRVKFLYQHDAREPIGRATMLREDAAGLYGEFKVSRVADGEKALELIRDGVIDSFSVGFAPVKHKRDGSVVVRTEVALREVSAVTFPAYEDARITGLREAIREMSEEEIAEFAEMFRIAIPLTPDSPPNAAASDPGPDTADPARPSARNRIRKAAFIVAAKQRGLIP